MKRYESEKLWSMGPVDGFMIHTPDDRELKDTHPQTIVKELNRMADRIQRLEEELMDAKNKHAVLVADVVLNEDRGERIKRLEEAGDKLHWAWMNPFDPAGETIVDNWRKAKEAK